MMEMSRSALVVKLINHYLGQAVYDFLSSYNSVFSHDKPEEVVVLDHIEGLLATKYPIFLQKLKASSSTLWQKLLLKCKESKND